MLSGVISWVGKQAQLNANVVSLGKGQQLIAQAITEWHIEPRGPRCPCLIPPVSPPFSSTIRISPHEEQGSQLLLNDWRCTGITIGCHTMNKAEHYNGARTVV